jgi:hypothetical protein
MKREETRLLETTVTRYDILHSGERAGYESVTRRVYSNNTLTLDAEVELVLPEGGRWDTETKLVLEEDSYFPRSYEIKKRMGNEERTAEYQARMEMVANVAVLSTRVNDKTETHNVVVPVGTPVFDTGVLNLVHQLLFWYDRRTGGRQRFTAFDPMTGKTNDLVMLLTGADTVDVMGESTEVEVFQIEQGVVTGKYFVDADGRLVGADLGFLSYTLSDEETVAGDGG